MATPAQLAALLRGQGSISDADFNFMQNSINSPVAKPQYAMPPMGSGAITDYERQLMQSQGSMPSSAYTTLQQLKAIGNGALSDADRQYLLNQMGQ